MSNNLLLPVLLVFLVPLAIYVSLKQRENFDATGLVYNKPPNWFQKKEYDPNDWVVNVYPERIQPSCLPYSQESKWGSLGNLNYNSQAYRFWRF